MPRTRQTFGAYITDAREALGKSRQQIADTIGCSYVAVMNWERNINRPRNLSALAKALRLPVRQFVATAESLA